MGYDWDRYEKSGYIGEGGPGSSVGIATDYGLDGPGIELQWSRGSVARADRPWGPPSLLYNGYRGLSQGKERPDRDPDPSLTSTAVVMEG